MKILMIDSHKGTQYRQTNLHWLNAEQIVFHLRGQGHEVDFIWSYPSVNSHIKSDYDVVIFNYSSRYGYLDSDWVTLNKDARFFFITNEYNLGENQNLYAGARDLGITYEVIANFDYNQLGDKSFFFGKYAVLDSHMVNLNTLIFEEKNFSEGTLFPEARPEKDGCVYWGSVRPNRIEYFKKYFDVVTVSTSQKNKEKFNDMGLEFESIPRIDWFDGGLWDYKFSLYIEDEFTHSVFNNLANRFYESLMYDVIPLFDRSCENTIMKSGIAINDWFFVDSSDDIKQRLSDPIPDFVFDYMQSWKAQAYIDKSECLKIIENIIEDSMKRELIRNEPKESKRPKPRPSALKFY